MWSVKKKQGQNQQVAEKGLFERDKFNKISGGERLERGGRGWKFADTRYRLCRQFVFHYIFCKIEKTLPKLRSNPREQKEKLIISLFTHGEQVLWLKKNPFLVETAIHIGAQITSLLHFKNKRKESYRISRKYDGSARKQRGGGEMLLTASRFKWVLFSARP